MVFISFWETFQGNKFKIRWRQKKASREVINSLKWNQSYQSSKIASNFPSKLTQVANSHSRRVKKKLPKVRNRQILKTNFTSTRRMMLKSGRPESNTYICSLLSPHSNQYHYYNFNLRAYFAHFRRYIIEREVEINPPGPPNGLWFVPGWRYYSRVNRFYCAKIKPGLGVIY